MLKIADVNPEVRIQWIETIPEILLVRDDISSEIEKGLAKTLIDTDPRVRKLSVVVFEEVPLSEVLKNITNDAVYSSLLHLTREKNRDVRELSINTVAKLYSNSLQSDDSSFQNNKVHEIINSIPSVLFNLYYINDPNINEQVDTVIFEDILPIDTDNAVSYTHLDVYKRQLFIMSSKTLINPPSKLPSTSSATKQTGLPLNV